jgi:hypothetical protein
MNCRYCHSEMFITDRVKDMGTEYLVWTCPNCLTDEHQEKNCKRTSVPLYFITAINKKIKSQKGKIKSEFNRGLTSELLKDYIRAGYTTEGNDRHGYRIYDDKRHKIIETDTWTEALFQLYLYNEEQKEMVKNEINKKECVVVC